MLWWYRIYVCVCVCVCSPWCVCSPLVRVCSPMVCVCSPVVCVFSVVFVFSHGTCVFSRGVCLLRGVCVLLRCVCVLPWCMCVLLWCVYALSNPSLRELPPELGQLGNLWQLDIEDLNIGNVPAEIRKEGRASSASQPRPLCPRERRSSLVVQDLEQTLLGTHGASLQLPCLERCCQVLQNLMVAVGHVTRLSVTCST